VPGLLVALNSNYKKEEKMTMFNLLPIAGECEMAQCGTCQGCVGCYGKCEGCQTSSTSEPEMGA
jgi:hypothetical protein